MEVSSQKNIGPIFSDQLCLHGDIKASILVFINVIVVVQMTFVQKATAGLNGYLFY